MNKQRASREGYDQGDDEIPSLDDFLHQVIIITSEVPIEKNDYGCTSLTTRRFTQNGPRRYRRSKVSTPLEFAEASPLLTTAKKVTTD
jgi:hypothetical protein